MKGYRNLKIVAATILGLMVLTLVYLLVTTEWMAPSAMTVNCAVVLGVLAKFLTWWLNVSKYAEKPERLPMATPRLMTFICMIFVLALGPGVWTGVLWAFSLAGGSWSPLVIFCFVVALLGSLCALYELALCIYYLIFRGEKTGIHKALKSRKPAFRAALAATSADSGIAFLLVSSQQTSGFAKADSMNDHPTSRQRRFR